MKEDTVFLLVNAGVCILQTCSPYKHLLAYLQYETVAHFTTCVESVLKYYRSSIIVECTSDFFYRKSFNWKHSNVTLEFLNEFGPWIQPPSCCWSFGTRSRGSYRISLRLKRLEHFTACHGEDFKWVSSQLFCCSCHVYHHQLLCAVENLQDLRRA